MPKARRCEAKGLAEPASREVVGQTHQIQIAMTKNPFRGIAVAHHPSPDKIKAGGQKHFRHVEGARDTRPRWIAYRQRECMRSRVDGVTIIIRPFRDMNPHPVLFLS